jgi:hypothetical protein
MTAPIVVGDEPFWLESVGESTGSSKTTSHTEGSATSETITESSGYSETFDVDDEPVGSALSDTSGSSTTTTTNESTTEAVGTSRARTAGRAQTLRSVREERPTHYYTLEESLHLAQLKLRNLPDRMAIVKRRGEQTVLVRTPDVRPVLEVRSTIERFREAVAAQSVYLAPVSVVEAELKARHAELLLPSGKVEAVEFWTEE